MTDRLAKQSRRDRKRFDAMLRVVLWGQEDLTDLIDSVEISVDGRLAGAQADTLDIIVRITELLEKP